MSIILERVSSILTDQRWTAGSKVHLHYISIILIISVSLFRVIMFFTSDIQVSNVATILLLTSGLSIQIFLRLDRYVAAARIATLCGLLAMFQMSLTDPVGHLLSVAGYIIGILLAALLLKDRTWVTALVTSVLLTIAASIAMASSPDNFIPEGYFSIVLVIQVILLIQAAIFIGMFYHRTNVALQEANGANVELKGLYNALADSEMQNRALMDLAVDGFLLIRNDGQILDVNKQIEQLLGYNRAELKELNVIDIDIDLTREEFTESFQSLAVSEGPAPFGIRAMHKDGSLIPIEVHTRPIEFNNEIMLYANFRDLRERLQYLQDLEESRKRLELVTNNVAALILYVEPDYTISYQNKMSSEWFGIDGSHNPAVSELLHEDSFAMFKHYFDDVFAGNTETIKFEWESALSNHFLITIIAHIIDDQAVGLFVTAVDYTERVKAENALAQKTELLQIITDTIPGRVTYANFDNELLFWNKHFADHYQCGPNTGPTNTTDIVPIEVHRHWQDHFKDMVAGKTISYELAKLLDGGNEEIAQYTIVPHVENGKINGFVTMSLDITELRNTQATLSENLARFQTVTDNVPARLVFFDRRGNILYVNKHVEKFGLRVEETIGRNPIDFLPADYIKAITPYFQRALKGESCSFELPLHWNNETIIERVFFYPNLVDGRVETIFGMHFDVTEIRKTEAALKQAQKMESLGVLAGGIAHDFNNLLVAMLGQNSLALVKLEQTHAARNHIVKAVTAAEQAASLTQQMLAYSGKGSFTISPLNINELICQNINLFEVSISKNIQLKLDLTDPLPLIEADHAQMQQVIMNLIINAGHAIGDNSGRITITTTTQDIGADRGEFWEITGDPLVPGPYVSIQIQDDGIGMDEETIEHIFDPFFTTKKQGSGLGLAAVVGIIRGHKGGIHLYSELGRGTVFHLLFPTTSAQVYQAPPPAEPEIEDRPVIGTVLIIDDEPTVSEAVGDILEMEGHHFYRADNGADGIALYREKQHEIDVVLLDLMMPGMNGEEVFLHLRKINPAIKVILSSGYSEAEATRRFVGRKLANFIQKPYDFITLTARVAAVIRGEEPETASLASGKSHNR